MKLENKRESKLLIASRNYGAILHRFLPANKVLKSIVSWKFGSFEKFINSIFGLVRENPGSSCQFTTSAVTQDIYIGVSGEFE